jgi:hypothetical protein
VPIPDDLIPDDASVEMEAKKAAGYFTPDAPPSAEDLTKVVGRDLEASSEAGGCAQPAERRRPCAPAPMRCWPGVAGQA